jgi:hypothetical protein
MFSFINVELLLIKNNYASKCWSAYIHGLLSVKNAYNFCKSLSGLGKEGIWIFKIILTESSSNKSFKIGKFQVLVLWLIRHATTRLTGSNSPLARGLKFGSQGTQGQGWPTYKAI